MHGQNTAMPWFYMSFADGRLPEGTQFLGACYVQAPSITDAITWTHVEGINPGGEVMFVELPHEAILENVPEANRNRLLTAAEIG